MVEQKKGPKQVSISAFFSPKKPGEKTDETKELEAKSSAAKRPRGSSNAAKSETKTEAKTETEEKPAAKKKAATAKTKSKIKGKTKASPKPKPKKKRQPRRFISPHANVGGDDKDDEDLDDEEDVFNTPEARRARAELESGGEIVPAGAPISGDAVVSDGEIVGVSDEDAKNGEGIAAEEKQETGTGGATADFTASADLTASDENTAKPVVENEDASKGRGKTAKATAAKAKPVAKALTKRQQKMKEKAAAAEAKPAPVEPLDPAIQARIDTYKLKMEELTRQFTKLLHSKQESDTLMQDIYGAGLDCDLNVTIEHDKAHQALSETWQKLREYAQSNSSAGETPALPSTVEFPHEVKSLIVKGIQGRTSSLSMLSSELLTSFKKEIESDDINMEAAETTDNTKISSDTDSVNNAAALAVEMEIKMLAQRTPHGVRPAKANFFEDTSADALWVWEVGTPEKYFGDEAQKIVKRMRKHRKRLGQQLKTLARVVQLLHQKPVDETKVSAEEAKVGKFGFVVDAEVQKARDRETKEQEKRQAAEDKKRHELERQQAKDEEKRKRELEAEEKEFKSSKRQKNFKSFFVQPKSNAGVDSAGSNGAGTSDSAIDVTGDQDTDVVSGETRSAKMARIDAAINFLGSDDAAASSSAVTALISQQSIFSSLKNKRDATKKETDSLSLQAWSARRHKDPKLGTMKLLQFYENIRPAYYGTFSTQSQLFHGGRRPFAQFSKFDYSVDSDDEWEEEEPGESLSDADSDGEESDEDNLDYEDQWLAYEDEVDYMDDVEADDDPMERGEGSASKHKLPSQLQKKRAKAKAMKPAKLEPQIVGPFWCSLSDTDACTDSHFSGLTAELLIEPMFESTLMRKAREYEEEQKRVEAERQEQLRKKEQQQELEKQKAVAAAVAQPPIVKKATTQKPAAQKVATKKTATQKAAPQKSTPQKASQKATPQNATPQKATPQKSPAKQLTASPSTGSAKSESAPLSATPSPAKPANPLLDAWLQKTPVTTSSPKPQQQEHREEDKEKESKEGDVEVISVD